MQNDVAIGIIAMLVAIVFMTVGCNTIILSMMYKFMNNRPTLPPFQPPPANVKNEYHYECSSAYPDKYPDNKSTSHVSKIIIPKSVPMPDPSQLLKNAPTPSGFGSRTVSAKTDK